MKYKVGDKVRIKSIDWYNKNKGNVDKTNSVWCKDDGVWFFYHMSQYCGKIMTIENVWTYSYTLEGSDSRWTDEMIEGLAEDEKVFPSYMDYDIKENEKQEPMKIMSNQIKDKNAFVDIANPEYDNVDTIELLCSNKFDVEIIHEDKIVLKRKKPKYPTTYKECCDVLGIDTMDNDAKGYKHFLVIQFQELLIARDAYWKLAGEEMGLGKPWEPDLTDNVIKYCIEFRDCGVCKATYSYTNKILSFPTAEMRDAFYENFKELIEQCKELL